MTVSNQVSRVIYNGDGSQTSFPITFVYNDTAQVKAVLVASDGAETEWTLGSEYTVNTSNNTLNTEVGYTPASGQKLVVYRQVALTQETAYPSNDPFPAASHEAALDKLTLISQQLQDELKRSIKQSISTSGEITFPAPAADKLIGWNGDGTALVNLEDAAASASQAAASATAAATSASAAAASAAGLNLPDIEEGDIGKSLVVNAEEDGYELSTTGISDGDKGDITVSASGAIWTVDNNSISLAKLADIDASTGLKVIGRSTSSSGDPELLNVLDEDNLSSDSATSLVTQQSVKAYVDAGDDIQAYTDGTIAGGDEILFADVDDSDAVKKTTAQDIADLATVNLPAAEAVGSYIIAKIGGAMTQNNTTAGSNLSYVHWDNVNAFTVGNDVGVGTWRLMGDTFASGGTSIFLRIA